MILPLALAQFIASYAATNMNVAITPIASDLGTTVAGVQTAITLFTLTMAALMIPGSKLTDIWGRKRCFVIGLGVYAVGGLLAALSQGLPQLIIGYSLLEGVGSALMIPPIYILVTVTFPDVRSRAKYFGVVSGAGGLGAAAGPLIGGLITSAISWRASFGLQVLVVAWIIWLARKITDPALSGARPRFDLTGAVLSAAGLFFVVLGLLQSRTYGFGASRQDFTIGGTVVIPKGSISPVWLLVAIGALFLLWFFLHVRSREKKGKDVLLPLRLFRNKVPAASPTSDPRSAPPWSARSWSPSNSPKEDPSPSPSPSCSSSPSSAWSSPSSSPASPSRPPHPHPRMRNLRPKRWAARYRSRCVPPQPGRRCLWGA